MRKAFAWGALLLLLFFTVPGRWLPESLLLFRHSFFKVGLSLRGLELVELNERDGISMIQSMHDQSGLLGYSVSMNGDVNGDGFADMLLGAYEASLDMEQQGAVHLLFGARDFGMGRQIILENEAISIYGRSEKAWFGHSVSIGGDIDGDGLADLAIGSRLEALESARNSGAAYVIFGKDLPSEAGEYSIEEIPHVRLVGERGRNEIGYEVLLGGDLDGDQIPDLVVRGFMDVPNKIAGVFIVPGKLIRQSTGQTIRLFNAEGIIKVAATEAFEDSGRTIALVPDFSGDALPELALGSLDGTAYYAPDLPQPTRPFAWIVPSELINRTDKGTLLLDDERVIGYEISSGIRYHVTITSLGDLDQDGLGDLLIGMAPLHNEQNLPGKALILLGASLKASDGKLDLEREADFTLTGLGMGTGLSGDLFGWALQEGPADIDGDGINDLLIGARGSSVNGSDSGAAFFVPGSEILDLLESGVQQVSLSEIPNVLAFLGEEAQDLFSSKRRITFSGDANGDGINDLLVGAPGWTRDGFGPGAAYWISGQVIIDLATE